MNRSDSPMIVRSSEHGIVQQFMAQVYGWMSVGLLLTAFVSWYTVSSDLVYTIAGSRVLFYGIIIAELALVITLSAAINRLSASMAVGMFMLYSVLTGLTFSVFFLIYTQSSITNIFFIAAGMFAALSVFGYTTKKDLSAMGSFLMMGLIGIIIASVVNIFMKSNTLMMMISYIGVLVFAGMTAYDTQKLKNLGASLADEQGSDEYRKSSILGALTLYLDFINLFIMLLRIMGERR